MTPESTQWTRREDYRYFTSVPTRWGDNDQFGHLNNVAYLRLFETLIVKYLAEAGLGWMEDPVVPYAAESLCRFLRPVRFPDELDLGIRIAHLGNSSVSYGMGMFRQGEEQAAATCHWVHVFVERKSDQPHPIPEALRSRLEQDL